MKRKLLLIFLLVINGFLFAQETNVPDDNFEAYLESHDADGNVVTVGDINSMGNGIANDNFVTTSRIASVTDLDISRLTISDATGIEGFIALENFRCFENPLSDIDLSQNVALLTIDIGKNNLTSLDFSTNTALTSVSCSRNQISSLNVSQNTLLETLGCSDNLINSLDVSNNTALKNLSCYSNPLGSLDVTQNLLLEDLDCVDTGLTVLDVTQNPELQELQVYENSLTSLDVSNNLKLIELYAEYNQITSLDVSKNTALIDLSIYDNQLTYLNMRNGNNTNLDRSDFDIRNNPGLTCVAVDDPAYANSILTDKDSQTVYTTFCTQTYVPDDNFEAYLETHNSTGLTVPLGDPTSMGNGIANDDHVGTEKIQNTTVLSISEKGIADFTGLEGFVNLEKLYTNRNTASTLDLTANTALIEVSCWTAGLTNINVSGLTSLEIIRAGENNLSTIDLSSNIALHSLYLDQNDFITIDISANTALLDFRIKENSLATLNVANNTNLTRLYCGDNSLTTLNITNNTELRTLSCGGNQLTTIDVSPLTKLTDLSIEDTPTLTALDVSSNINLEDIEVYNNTSLTTLDLSSTTKLIEAYINNTGITTLDFDNSPQLEYVECQNNNALTSLSFKSGNTSSIDELYATGNPNLFCIQVDDPAATYLNGWEKDATTGFSDDCNWTYVPDDNFENYLETHDADNNFVSVGDPTSMGNGIANDNYVTTANIENVMSLFIAFQGVTDITGLEDFTSLETLFIFSNTLTDTNLDLTSNTNLTRIDGGDMGLTSIDITGLTSLERLDIPRNDLTSIDLSTNTALKELIISSNDLSGLDVSNNLLLEDLQIHETTLSSIDVSANVNLTRILASLNQFTLLNTQNNTLLETLNLSRNPLTSYDVNHLSNLQDLNLDETNITSIDISKNANLVEFNARDINELVELNVKNGNNSNFTEFRVTGCPSLTCIEVDDPTANYLTGWLKDATANFAKYCRFTYVPDDNFENYLETHQENTGSVPFGDDRSLGNGIMDDYVPTEKIENLTILFIENQGISDFTGLEDFKALQRFRAHGNPVNGALDLTPNVNLTQVFCWNMGLTGIDLTGLTTLYQLVLNDNNLTALDVTTNTLVEDIDIENNNLTALDISQNTEITGLNYTNNTIQAIDLSQNTKLITFIGIGNTISTINLQNNTLLETIEIGNNPISNLDASIFPNLVNLKINNTNVERIDVSNNPNISTLICNDTEITELDLRDNANMYTLEVHNNAITELNLGNLTRLNTFNASNNQLTLLNLRNGNNDNMASVDVTGNLGLTCIEVDDPTIPELATWSKDNTASYAEFCRLTYVPDDAFETFLENNGYGNGVANDDYVYTALIEVSEGFNIHNGLVEDMTGIEDFRDMWFLGCRNNTNLTSINLSKNTKLTVITLANNNLASLDLSNNVLLEQVYLDGNTNLGDVDISNLTSLTNLSLSNTGINSVDISMNPLLRQLILNDNNFTEFDISNYPNIIQLRIANNQLTSLNVANGNNDNFTWFDAQGNPDLTCIKADKVVPLFPEIWEKDDTANFAIYCDLTYVPDDNFENYLETHDADGNVVAVGDATSMGNGIANDDQVATLKIENVTALNVESQSIANLTGIEAFAALESLNVDYNDLTTLDLSNNTNLKVLDAAENDFITLDLSGYLSLEEVQLRSNSLTSLLVDNNPNLKKLGVGKNGLSTLDVTSCTQLEELAAHQNVLESLDVRNGNNNLITDFFVKFNDFLTCIQVDDPTAAYLSSWEKDDIASFSTDCVPPVITLLGDNPQIIELGAGYTELGATIDDGVTDVVIDASAFVDTVGSYTIRYNATDAAGNVAVEVTRTVDVVDTTPPVITILGDNPQIIEQGTGYTELGATVDDGVTNILIDASDFVDAVGEYTIRYNATDNAGNMAVEVIRIVNVVDTCPLNSLPDTNFTIQTTSETCSDKNNGTINITADADLNYVVTINEQEYDFNSSLTISDVSPDTYAFCITVDGYNSCKQCFEATINEAESLVGKTTLQNGNSNNEMLVEINSGTAPYTVTINNDEVGIYNDTSFSVKVVHGDDLVVSSNLDCEGTLTSKVSLLDQFTIAPNPTKGNTTLFVPNFFASIQVSMYNSLGILISSASYTVSNNQLELPMKELPNGVYFVSINEEKVLKVIKN
ncbi:immunoglobulin-like domain-containing protein [Aquimarina sp. 2201CG1-2-11]|uniref:immunoglobulin-like domain-containing protein n=1 Tax=Aquimarina discodermiae TaxID=3231043 RepID=UPI0034630C25